ncbi:CTP synthase [Trichinella spiralis]|uniref:CTP synthase n=1 Tax=Trichinella spiralis TaxID=6334 RepID=A0ABR3KIU6_TRISP
MIAFCETFLMMFSIVLVTDALLFSGYLEEENLSCLFGSARYRGDIEHCTNEAHARVSYARCIRLCVNASFHKECNAVFYFPDTQSCLVMNVSESDLHSDGDMFLDIAFIYECKGGNIDLLLDAESANMDESILDSTVYISSAERHRKKYFYQKTRKDAFSDALLIRTFTTPTVESCVIICDHTSQLNNCNAVTYTSGTKSCSFYSFSSFPTLYPGVEENGTAFYILYLSFRDEIQVHTLEIPSNESLPYLLRISNVISTQSQHVDQYSIDETVPPISFTPTEEEFAR